MQERKRPFFQRLIRNLLQLLIRGRKVSIDLAFKSDEIELDVASLIRARVSVSHPSVEGNDFTGELNVRPGWLGWIVRRNMPDEVRWDDSGKLRVALPEELRDVAKVDQITVDQGRLHFGLTLQGLPRDAGWEEGT